MAKHWTFEQDLYLARYFDVAGAWNMGNDLGRPVSGVHGRVKRLKECGAWSALRHRIQAEHDYTIAYMIAVGKPGVERQNERFVAVSQGLFLDGKRPEPEGTNIVPFVNKGVVEDENGEVVGAYYGATHAEAKAAFAEMKAEQAAFARGEIPDGWTVIE